MGFKPGWRMTAFTAFFLPAVVALGLWQVERGAEKRAMEMDYLARLTALSVPIGELTDSARFQRVKLYGSFDHHIFFLDNQVYQGQTGYWIVQVFNEAGGKRYLVNRGFTAAPASRADLPNIQTPTGNLHLIGTVWPFTGLIPVLDADEWSQQWPKRIQRLDVARMAAAVGAEPVEVRLEPGQPGVTIAAPFATVLSDAKHRGYAATWFGLAFVLVAGYVFFGIKSARLTRTDIHNR